MHNGVVAVVGVACLTLGIALGALLTSSPPAAPSFAPADVGQETAFVAPQSSSAADEDDQAELELLRSAVAMSEAECSRRFLEAGCIDHIAWPPGSDPAEDARRLDAARRACPAVHPESVHVDCDEYPCAVAYLAHDPDGPGGDHVCPPFRDLQHEMSPRGHSGGLVTTSTGEERQVVVFLPGPDAAPDIVTAAERRRHARVQTLLDLVESEEDPGDAAPP